jgi:hypothetical protein
MPVSLHGALEYRNVKGAKEWPASVVIDSADELFYIRVEKSPLRYATRLNHP